MTHVFIVNDKTFPYHLAYRFAGTGGSSDAPFLAQPELPYDKETGLSWGAEKNMVSMIADISRDREGDDILFYLRRGENEGRFYGVFRAVGSPFYDANEHNYLADLLGRTLNLRVCIEPARVYAKGVTEHKVLDSLDGVSHPSQLFWSLIYRKLKGNRGCTMLTDYEADRLVAKIAAENGGAVLSGTDFTYDAQSESIVPSCGRKTYGGSQGGLSIEKRLVFKQRQKQAFETHLQAFLLQNIWRDDLSALLEIDPARPLWLGNEVPCGVGMQRMDVVTRQETAERVLVQVLELKDEPPGDGILTGQLPWYIDWLQSYWGPLTAGRQLCIRPVVVAQGVGGARLAAFRSAAGGLRYARTDALCVEPVRFIAFSIGDAVAFERVF